MLHPSKAAVIPFLSDDTLPTCCGLCLTHLLPSPPRLEQTSSGIQGWWWGTPSAAWGTEMAALKSLTIKSTPLGVLRFSLLLLRSTRPRV